MTVQDKELAAPEPEGDHLMITLPNGVTIRRSVADIKKQERLAEVYDAIATIVNDHGPLALNRGMPALQANEAILACLKQLTRTRDLPDPWVDRHMHTLGDEE